MIWNKSESLPKNINEKKITAIPYQVVWDVFWGSTFVLKIFVGTSLYQKLWKPKY